MQCAVAANEVFSSEAGDGYKQGRRATRVGAICPQREVLRTFPSAAVFEKHGLARPIESGSYNQTTVSSDELSAMLRLRADRRNRGMMMPAAGQRAAPL